MKNFPLLPWAAHMAQNWKSLLEIGMRNSLLYLLCAFDSSVWIIKPKPDKDLTSLPPFIGFSSEKSAKNIKTIVNVHKNWGLTIFNFKQFWQVQSFQLYFSYWFCNDIHTKVLYFCVGFRELSHLTRDISQAEKKVNVVTSWANAQNELK